MKKRKIKRDRITSRGKLVPVETPAEIRSQFPDKLIKSYIEVVSTDFENIKIYNAFIEMMREYLGNKANKDTEVGLVVRLTRAIMDIEIKTKCTEHSNYRGMRRPRSGCKRCWTIYNEQTKAKKTTKKAEETKEKETEKTA